MRTHALGLVVVSTLVVTATTAFADVANPDQSAVLTPSSAAQVLTVGSGAKRGRIDGEMRLRYPGFEQSTVVNTKGHLVVITMEAVQEPGKAPVQCSCSS